MKMNDLHDQIKRDYENGSYDGAKDTPYYTEPSEVVKNKRILRIVEPVSVILLVLAIYRGLHISNTVRGLILLLFICNALAVIYFASKVHQAEKHRHK